MHHCKIDLSVESTFAVSIIPEIGQQIDWLGDPQVMAIICFILFIETVHLDT